SAQQKNSFTPRERLLPSSSPSPLSNTSLAPMLPQCHNLGDDNRRNSRAARFSRGAQIQPYPPLARYMRIRACFGHAAHSARGGMVWLAARSCLQQRFSELRVCGVSLCPNAGAHQQGAQPAPRLVQLSSGTSVPAFESKTAIVDLG